MSDFSEIHLVISDGTFIEWLYEKGLYNEARDRLYQRWKQLYSEFKLIEFERLSSLTGGEHPQ